MARKKASPTSRHEAAEAPPLEDASGKTITKAEAVRQALSAGMDAPGDIADFLKSQFGLEMSKPMVSAYKSLAKKKAEATMVKLPRGRKPRAAVEGYLAPPRIEAKGDRDLLNALEAMKPLVATLGVEKVKRLAELLG
ncbi:hypothetical protein OJF2_40920 [Aquisphaera giovannonii]|uniref:Uncharacterized protein n=1 Tax=Aquisphaera giovannonii TaxID=406548 RepID=A0A5B9W6D5_9BACT|nr:hypothetical protein [Aquisphaera giovannonii]QEH35540.1 hypothetical protein OJF2_40920 [Aquisphaera giovannonii]